MPHRKNAKSDIGTAKSFSDTYDADNIYLSEEGWVYRHFKNTERTLWWDEILVAGQVKPGMSIHGVSNGDSILGAAGSVSNSGVMMTNPYKLGTVGDANFQEDTVNGDGVNDYRYSDHMYQDVDGTIKKLDKVVVAKTSTDSKTGYDQIAWTSLNIPLPTEGDLSTQIPLGWTDVSTPADSQFGAEPPYPNDTYQSVNYNTEAPDSMPGIPPQIIVGKFDTVSGVNPDYTLAGEVPASDSDTDAGIPPELPGDSDDDVGEGILPVPQ